MSYEQEPLYIQIKGYILEQINNGEVKAGDKLPSEKELTELFNVSRITVRNALSELQSEGIVTRISGKGTFVTDNKFQAKNNNLLNNDKKIRGSNKLIGVIMCHLDAPFQVRLFVSIEQELKRLGYQMVFALTNGVPEKENEQIEKMLESGVVGLIIYPTDGKFYNENILKLSIEAFPVVLVDRYLPGINTCSVYSDDKKGAYDLGKYLLSKGHENIGLLSPVPGETVPLLNRLDGFSEAILDNGKTINSDLWITELLNCPVPDEENRHLENIKRIEKLLKEHKDITALYAINSLIALTAYKAVLNLGYTIPRDIEIVCFDNATGYFSIEDYPITYIDHAETEMGRFAAKSIIEIIIGNKQENTVLPCKLVHK